MAKIKLLSARSINTLANGFYADGGNLFLRVRGNSRVWIFRYKKMSKQIVIGLGATHARSLQEARDIAEKMRNAIINSKNPADILQSKLQHEVEKEGFKKLNLSYEDLLHHAATAVVYLKIQDYEVNELIAKFSNNAIQIINESSLPEKEKESITGKIFEQLRIDIAEIRTDRNKEIASSGGMGKVAQDSDGKQAAKSAIHEQWIQWQNNPDLR